MAQGIVMFSGGLDSTIVIHLLKCQGLDIKAVHFVLPFYSGLNYSHKTIKSYAAALGVPLMIIEEAEDYVHMIKNQLFGFGKNANPCIDCRIYRLKQVRKIMEQEGASFIATGEVAGQRPKSQRIDCMNTIENRAGVKGFLLRPLSAKLFQPTQPELDGTVDREKLFDWSGRGRKNQLDYALKYNLQFASPAGGCILTTIDSSRRFHELADNSPDYSLTDFKLLAYGRHFRINNKVKFIIARNESENNRLLQLIAPCNEYLQLKNSLGPIGIIRGEFSQEDLHLCSSLLGRFSKEKMNDSVETSLVRDEIPVLTFTIAPATDQLCSQYRI